MVVPKNLLYSKTHEWVLRLGDKARVGLTDFAQDALGDIVFLNLPEIGAIVDAGGTIGEVESVKAVSDVCAPIGGTICAVNDALANSPELINAAPYENWIFEVDSADSAGAAGAVESTVAAEPSGADGGGLLTPEQYEAFCQEEGHS